jgi:hypothetical protein
MHVPENNFFETTWIQIKKTNYAEEKSKENALPHVV